MSNLSPINLMTGGLAHVVFSSWTVVFCEWKPRHVCDDILHNRLWVQQQQACIGASYQKEHTSRMACPKVLPVQTERTQQRWCSTRGRVQCIPQRLSDA